jgi:uncharacterized repeat protein (TIGR01451 family)
VDNPSQAPAHHVLVRDRLPGNVKFIRASPEPRREKQDQQDLLWDLGTLAPQARIEIVVEVQPDGSGDVESKAFVQFEHGQAVRTRVARPDLRLRVIAPPHTKRDETLTFRLEVTNTGSMAVSEVVVTDRPPPELRFLDSKPSTKGENPLTWKIGSLGPGQSRVVEYSVATPSEGTFRNNAEVTAAGGLLQKAYASVVVAQPKLTIQKTGPSRWAVGRPTTYRITVRNEGGVPVTGVQITDFVPPRGITFLRADGAYQLVGNEVRWRLGTLPEGQSRTLQVQLQANERGVLKNRAHASADGHPIVESMAVTEFETGPVVEIDKADRVEVGQRSSCKVRVYNAGTTPVASLRLTISVLDNLRILSASGFTEGKTEGALVRFDPIPTLAPGLEAPYMLELQGVKPGAATLRCDLQNATGQVLNTREEPLSVDVAPSGR